MLRLFFYVILVGVSQGVEPSSCPVCSRYDYEVNILERVLSNELALKNTLEKITETHAKVEDTLKAIQAENVKLNDAMAALEVKKKDIDNKLASAIQAGVSNVSGTVSEMKTTVQVLVTQTAKELKAMKEQSVVPLVMFSARFHSDGPNTLAANQNVVFKTVPVNEGGGYDPSTGHFTASVAGVYIFTVQYCPLANSQVYLEIVLEGRALQRSRHWERESAVCVSMQAFAKVATGDKVSVRAVISESTIFHYENQMWCSFAGLLIHM